MNKNKKHWTSELLTLFGVWLWKKGEYGHALLCIHGPQWGYKIGQQLKITWDCVLHTDDHEVKIELWFPDKDELHRPIDGLARDYIELLYKQIDKIDWEDTIYKNYGTGKPLTTSTLNRELQKFSEEFIKELEDKLDDKIILKPLKSNAFQIAWALKMLERYHYSKKCFVEVSKFMGHRTLKDTISLLEMEPFDEIVYDFNGIYFQGGITPKILEDSDAISRIVMTAEYDAYSQFKLSISYGQ